MSILSLFTWMEQILHLYKSVSISFSRTQRLLSSLSIILWLENENLDNEEQKQPKLAPVDEMDPESEVSVVDVEAVGTFVHRPIAPLRGLLGPDLPALLIGAVDVCVLYVVQLHVRLVVGGDGHVVLGLDVGHQVVPDEQQGLVADGALVVVLSGDLWLSELVHVLLHPDAVCLVQVSP